MREINGNLARKIYTGYAAPEIREAEPQPAVRLPEVQEDPRYLENVWAFYKASQRNQLIKMVKVFMLCLTMAGMFAYMLLSENSLMEANFKMNSLMAQIETVKKENNQMKQDIMSEINITEIQQEAINDLNMQAASDSQVIKIIMPEKDKIIHQNEEKEQLRGKENLSALAQNLESYFSSIKK